MGRLAESKLITTGDRSTRDASHQLSMTDTLYCLVGVYCRSASWGTIDGLAALGSIGRERGPTLYPVACSPQAWAAGTPLLLLQSSLELEFNSDCNETLLRKPRLPSFLDEVTLCNLRLGQSVVNLTLRRHGNDVSIQVMRNEGHIRVAAIYS